MRRAVLAVGCLLLAGCELEETTIAEAEPFVVAESYLMAGARPQVALHASVGADHLLEQDATIRLAGPDTTITLSRTAADGCLGQGYRTVDPEAFPGGLACYEVADHQMNDGFEVLPGELYRLSIVLPDGSRLDGATRVPEQVVITRPSIPTQEWCYLEPWTQLELTWNPAAGTAAYIPDLRIFHLAEALAAAGIPAQDLDDPLTLRGLSIGQADTAIVLPAEFGVFDRFAIDPDVALALQQGLPEGVVLDVTLGAVDQNFVEWVRGGDFNPSGLIRTPSLFGDAGTGVFASVTVGYFVVTTREEDRQSWASCATS